MWPQQQQQQQEVYHGGEGDDDVGSWKRNLESEMSSFGHRGATRSF